MKKTQRRVQLTVLAVALAMAVLPPGVAGAAKPDQGFKVKTTIQVVAQGLDTPRGVFYDKGTKRVLVAEAGEGGPSSQAGGTCGAANGGAIYCLGMTGAVYAYSTMSGSGSRIAEGLASIANYNADGSVKRSVLGIHDVAVRQGTLHGVFGLSGRQFFRDGELGPDAIALSQTVTISQSGVVTPYGDLVAYEEQHNPHFGSPNEIIDADPYGMAVGSYGTVVADAAGNDLLRVNPDGSIDLLAVFANRDVPEFNDFIESVPTSVAQGPDGAFYVGELTGFPYYKGKAVVWRVVPGQAPTVYASGFTNIADLTFDDKGRLVVLEMAKEGLFAGAPNHNGDTVTGRLVRVEKNGSHTTLATTGLSNPGGVAYTGKGVYYVTNGTTGVGDTGELLKITVKG